MSVLDRFQTLLGWIEPTQTEIDHASSHLSTIKVRLEKDFNLHSFLLIGSHARGTPIKKSSDVDCMAVFRKSEVEYGSGIETSTTFLNRLRTSLQDRYPNTEIRRDKQAVVVGFGGNDYSVDVVPGYYYGPGINNYPVYKIPDGNGWWMSTSPQAHNKYIMDENIRSRGKLINVAKLIKYWRICRQPNIQIMSFHIELLLAQSEICIGPKSYAQCLMETFQLLSNRECRALQDPIGVSGLISSCKTGAQIQGAINSVNYAYNHAFSAINAEAFRPIQEAYDQWDIVFNGYFPKK